MEISNDNLATNNKYETQNTSKKNNIYFESKENDNEELNIIENNIKPIKNNTDKKFIQQNSFSNIVKQKYKPRAGSWAHQACSPKLSPSPMSDNSEFMDACFGDDIDNQEKNNYEVSKNNSITDDYQQVQNYAQDQNISFQNELLDRIEFLENTIDMLIEDTDKQKEINRSIEEAVDMNYYLNIDISIHAIDNQGKNHIKFIKKEIPLKPNNYRMVTFCDIDEENGDVKYDDAKLIDFLKKTEPKNNIKEKHITYWINKAIHENNIINLDIISVKIENNNNHIKSKLKKIFTDFKKQFQYQQILQQKIEESKIDLSTKNEPKFYINSKNVAIKEKFNSTNKQFKNKYKSKKFIKNNEIAQHKDNVDDIDDNVDEMNDDMVEQNDLAKPTDAVEQINVAEPTDDVEQNDKAEPTNAVEQNDIIVDNVSSNNSKFYKKINKKKDNNIKRQQFVKLSLEEQDKIINLRSAKDCWNFINTGTCQFGDNCHYKHDEAKRIKKLQIKMKFQNKCTPCYKF